MMRLARLENMKRLVAMMAMILLLALNTTSCNGMSENPGSGNDQSAAISGSGQSARMPAFELVSAVDGSSVSSNQYRDQVLLVTFFATWCTPCLEEIPSLKDLQNSYASRGFSVVALSMDVDGRKVVQRLVEKMAINYPVLMADNAVTRGFGGVSGLPTAFLINRQGEIVRRYIGYVGHAVLEKDIAELLAADESGQMKASE